MGGRSSEPVVAGVNPEWRVSGAKRASIMAMGSGVLAGNVTECAQAQWQLRPSPRRQGFASSADTVLTAVSANKVVEAAAVAEANRAPGPSAPQIDPLTSLISNTATANTHNPRWRRRRVNSDGADQYIFLVYTTAALLDNFIWAPVVMDSDSPLPAPFDPYEGWSTRSTTSVAGSADTARYRTSRTRNSHRLSAGAVHRNPHSHRKTGKRRSAWSR